MDKRKRNLLLGGALVAGGVAGFAYLYTKNKETKKPAEPAKVVSRELVVRVLKEIQREMFGVLTNIAMIANQIKEQSRGRVANNEIKEFLLNHNTQTKDQIKHISEGICEKYGLEEKDLRYACEVTFPEDKDIRALLADSKTVFDKAFMGIPPDLRAEIPAFLTPELTLNLMRKIMKESLFKIQDFLGNLKAKGISISMQNPQVLMGLQDLKLDDIRKDILVEEGLDKFQDPPLKIFQFATQKYSTEDPEQFNQKFMKLEMQNQRAMEALMKDAPDAHIMIEAIGSHLAKDAEEIVASHLKNSRLHKPAVVAEKPKNEETSPEDEELKALEHIKSLQHQVSFQLKNALEDSDFPQELVESAVNTLFNVFDNMNKKYPASASQTDISKVKEGEGEVVEENVLLKDEDVKVEEVKIVDEEGKTEETAVVVESTGVEVKEVKDDEGNNFIETTTEEKVTIATEDGVHQVRVEETTMEKVEEAAPVENNEQQEEQYEQQ